MTTEEILKSETEHVRNGKIAGIECSVGTIKKFKWSWFATQLNTFVFIGETDQIIDKTLIENFSRNCFEYAVKHNTGWPRGFQSGIASIAILKGSSIDNSAIEFCSRFSKKHWSAFEMPLLYDTTQNKIIKNQSGKIWGAIYVPYLNNIINAVTRKFQ